MKSTLTIKNLYASIGEKEILRGVDLTIESGNVYALMGPNGSGKSTLAYAIMGHPSYEVPSEKGTAKSEITLDGKDLLELSTDERAKTGLFLALQSPIAIPGVSVMNLLRTAYEQVHGNSGEEKKDLQNPALARRWQAAGMTLAEFVKQVKAYAAQLSIDPSFLERGIHDGFSGGEKKKIEMLQALILAPKFAIFDEIDTGLDVDALKVVARGIELLKENGTGVIIITHYQRILHYVQPDTVHVFVKGKVVATGDATLAKEIEEQGYKRYLS